MKEFAQDILGNPAALELGLVDAESIDEHDVMIDSLELHMESTRKAVQ